MTHWVSAEDLYLSIRTDGEVYDDLIDICRTAQGANLKAKMLAQVRKGWTK